MPSSPRFLVKVGRLDEAKALLIRLRAPSSPPPSFKDEKPQENDENKAAIAEHTSILDAVQLERKHAGMNSYWNMFWARAPAKSFTIRTIMLIFTGRIVGYVRQPKTEMIQHPPAALPSLPTLKPALPPHAPVPTGLPVVPAPPAPTTPATLSCTPHTRQ
ncbi:hypothetical protein DXG01_004520 [Tephrocybe rancida]|nr:hypothetical protein DXG01_004520 [Tephrocybe rancida]